MSFLGKFLFYLFTILEKLVFRFTLLVFYILDRKMATIPIYIYIISLYVFYMCWYIYLFVFHLHISILSRFNYEYIWLYISLYYIRINVIIFSFMMYNIYFFITKKVLCLMHIVLSLWRRWEDSNLRGPKRTLQV